MGSRLERVDSLLVIQNKTNSETRHLVLLIFKKEQENEGVGDISSIFRVYSNITDSVVSLFFLEYQEYKMSIFGICFILYFLKLSACRGLLVIMGLKSLLFLNS